MEDARLRWLGDGVSVSVTLTYSTATIDVRCAEMAHNETIEVDLDMFLADLDTLRAMVRGALIDREREMAP